MSGGTIVFQTSYVRDSLDRISQVTETMLDTTRVVAFSYDSAGRLQEARRDGVLTATYEYHLNGNRTHLTTPSGTVTGTYDAQDRLTSYGTATYTYGSNGELKTRPTRAARPATPTTRWGTSPPSRYRTRPRSPT
jgi:YD repeat-containing protein